MVKSLKKFWPQLTILSLSLYIFIVNFKINTFLTGWDTLHPEFDLILNFKRAFFGVWRVEQGLGAIAGHSHMADLPRIILLWILNTVLPLNLLRYSYIFLMFLIGGLGTYFFISYLFFKLNIHKYKLLAFIGSLLYLFNLSTIQNFFVPFEMFPTQFGFLPWIILFSIKFITEKKQKNLILFSVFTLLSTPQAYAAHLWYVFFGIYTAFLLLLSFLRKKDRFVFRRSLFLIFITLIINSFWLLPNLYFVTTSSDIPRNSKQNRIFSQEYRLRNREHGNIENVALLKGFYFNWSIYDFEANKSVPLMKIWQEYTDNWFIKSIGYLMFLSSIAGIYLAFYKKNKILMSLSPLFAIPFVFLMNNTFPFNKLFDFLLKFSLFNEGLRFVFNKFSVIFTFSYVLFFSYFLSFIINNKNKLLNKLIPVIVISAILIVAAPAFKGNLISEKVQVKIPTEYFDFWKFMKDQDQGVVFTLPIYNFPGWEYYKWGYQGAGFLWFGLKQPVLVRDFDRWSTANEQAFREFNYSVYLKNPDFFEKNIKKYKIKYILWDKNITIPSEKNRDQILYTREIAEILTSLENKKIIKKINQFKNIYLYEITKNYSKTLQTNSFVWPVYEWNNFDYAYFNHGEYISYSDIKMNNILYPFRNFVDSRDRINKFVIDKDLNQRSFRINIPNNFKYDSFILPSLSDEKILISDLLLQKTKNNELELTIKPLLLENIQIAQNFILSGQNNSPDIRINLNGREYLIKRTSLINEKVINIGQAFINQDGDNFLNGRLINLNFQVEESNISNQLKTKFPTNSINITPKQIYQLNKSQKVIELNNSQKSLTFNSKGETNGINLEIDDLPQYLGYALVINSKNISGIPLRLCFKSFYSDVCTLYDELTSFSRFDDDIFLVPPSGEGLGYKLILENVSYGNFITNNSIQNTKIIPFPYNFLSRIYAEKDNKEKEVKVISNYQSFHQGWIAYLNNKKLENKVLVDNWANGWIVDENANINEVKFVFWPQYLEYLGFAMLIFSFAWMSFWKKVD